MTLETVGTVSHLVAVVVTFIAAITDARTGRIPNALTYLALLVGPFLWGVVGGPRALLESVMGVLFWTSRRCFS